MNYKSEFHGFEIFSSLLVLDTSFCTLYTCVLVWYCVPCSVAFDRTLFEARAGACCSLFIIFNESEDSLRFRRIQTTGCPDLLVTGNWYDIMRVKPIQGLLGYLYRYKRYITRFTRVLVQVQEVQYSC